MTSASMPTTLWVAKLLDENGKLKHETRFERGSKRRAIDHATTILANTAWSHSIVVTDDADPETGFCLEKQIVQRPLPKLIVKKERTS